MKGRVIQLIVLWLRIYLTFNAVVWNGGARESFFFGHCSCVNAFIIGILFGLHFLWYIVSVRLEGTYLVLIQDVNSSSVKDRHFYSIEECMQLEAKRLSMDD